MVLKKALAIVCTAALLSIGCLSLAACQSQDPVEAVRDTVETQFNKVKDLDEETLQQYTTESDDNESEDFFKQYGISYEDFLKAYFDGFDYSIDDITMNDDDNEAIVTITLTIKSYNEVMTDVMQSALSTAFDLTLSEDERNQALGDGLMEAADKVSPSELKPIELTYTLNDDDEWDMTNESQNELTKAVFAS